MYLQIYIQNQEQAVIEYIYIYIWDQEHTRLEQHIYMIRKQGTILCLYTWTLKQGRDVEKIET